MIRALPLLLLLTLFLSGCSEDATLSENSLPIRPLAIGTVWIGSTTLYDTTGAVRAVNYDTLKIVSDTLINGERWFSTNKGGGSRFITSRSDGFWLLDTAFPDQPWRDLKHPAVIQEVCSRDTVYVGPGFKYFFVYEQILLEKRSEVTVQAGTFPANCYSLMQKDSKGDALPDSLFHYRRDRMWMAPGVGHIKSEDYERTASGRE